MLLITIFILIAIQPSVSKCDGDLDCCHPESPCRENEGDCDTDADCFGELLCGQNTGMWYKCSGLPVTQSSGHYVLSTDCCYDVSKCKDQ